MYIYGHRKLEKGNNILNGIVTAVLISTLYHDNDTVQEEKFCWLSNLMKH